MLVCFKFHFGQRENPIWQFFTSYEDELKAECPFSPHQIFTRRKNT